MGDINPRLLDAVYAAIDDDAAYARLPQTLCDAFRARSGSIFLLQDGGGVIEAAHGFEADMLDGYARDYVAIDPWRQAFAKVAPNTATRFDRLVAHEAFARSAYYNDFARKHGDFFHGLGVVIDDGCETRVLSVQRARRDPAFTDAHEAALREIRAHLSRVFRARRGLATGAPTALLTENLFEDRSDAILLCDATQRVLHLNRAARGLPLAFVAIGRNGRLTFGTQRAQDAFVKAIDDAVRQRISTSFHVARTDKLPYRIDVDGATTATPVAIVTILDFERQVLEQIARAQRLYAFTPSECALAESLLRGRTAQEHAALRGTAVSTARAQLHMMLAKSDTNRQAELIAVLSR